jgi:antitoxin HicB
MRYPIILAEDDNATLLVTSPDFPELTTFGDDRDDALFHAADALETAIAERMANREEIPTPSAVTDAFVALGALAGAKIALHQAMIADGIRKTTLAQRLHCHLPQIDRLLDLRHASRLDQLEAAFRVLGRELDITVKSAA